MNAPVLVLAPTLDGNAVGRALLLWDLISPYRDVYLVGPRAARKWAPLESRGDVPVIELPGDPYTAGRRLRHRFPMATVIASKPLFMSYGTALAAGLGPVVLDIDDPELELATSDVRTVVSAFCGMQNPLLTAGCLAMRNRAAGITVASAALQRRYGGSEIPHARDETRINETRRHRARARSALGLSASERIVAFVGTVRRHKGVDLLKVAMAQIAAARLALIGTRDPDPIPGEINTGPVPYDVAIDWVSAADIIVVPQRRDAISNYQSPAKLVDALAVGRAIVATRVDPVEEMVGDAGLLVPPDSARDLRAAIDRILGDDPLRESFEAAARERFLARYSFSVVRPRLLDVLDHVESSWSSSRRA